MSDQETTTSTTERVLYPRPPQDEAWLARAVTLGAESPHLLPATTELDGAQDDPLHRFYQVVSTRPLPEGGLQVNTYVVSCTVAPEGQIEWRCSCEAGRWGRACKHVGSAMTYRAAQEQAKRKGRDCPECAGLGALADATTCPSCDGSGWFWLPE